MTYRTLTDTASATTDEQKLTALGFCVENTGPDVRDGEYTILVLKLEDGAPVVAQKPDKEDEPLDFNFARKTDGVAVLRFVAFGPDFMFRFLA